MLQIAAAALALQLTVAPQPAVQGAARELPVHARSTAVDSARDLGRARSAQAAFEKSRRAQLPISYGGSGRCDVRLGRYCWWYDETTPKFPPEATSIIERRAELLAELDALSARYPGDDWLAGMRVHYRIDGKHFPAADSAASACRASAWWCSALTGYAAHARGNEARADSAFNAAIAAMTPDEACAWRNITPLLGGGDRDGYEHRACEARAVIETRYWVLSQPQLATRANEWRNEFNVRRVLVHLAEHAATPHALAWGDDAAELVLRYGWPAAWSRVLTSSVNASDPAIIGHDPSPSFTFAPGVRIGDSASAVAPDAWDMNAPRGETRYAPHQVGRMTQVAAQFARFRRGDSTLVVAAFAARDDSLVAPVATLVAAHADSAPLASVPDTSHAGRARLMLGGVPVLVGMELIDTTMRTLARTRVAFAPVADSARLAVSDLLVYRAGEDMAGSLDSALAHAIPGDTVTKGRPLGVFWETYGLSADGESVDVAVSVERIDHSWIRSTRQKLGLTPMDTPIKVRWTDARPPANQAAPHAISMDLENLDPGRYRLTLTLTPSGGAAATSTREIALQNP
ncbi:MAG: hypothetical protein JWM95_5648 [Gemmatimonadetes bacterium]|nr:hypothetical protein [Gemmatimonadota bacterium]